MPASDWTRVSPGIFHHFHSTWVPEIARSLNAGVLPSGYYALAEQVTSDAAPDVIALELTDRSGSQSRTSKGDAREGADTAAPSGTTATLPSPRASVTLRTENVTYASLRKTITIRHVEGHEVVALIEVLSHANKASRSELEAFLRKAQAALKQGIHLLIVDLYPPGRLDPRGVHGELWAALGQTPPTLPLERPLIAAAYEAREEITAYLEPFAVGDELPEVPLFLDEGLYVSIALEATYRRAYEAVPPFWRARIEGTAG